MLFNYVFGLDKFVLMVYESCFEFSPELHKPPLLIRYRRSRYSKNAIAYFLKEAKAAVLQLRSPPAVEAEITNLKELSYLNKVYTYWPLKLKQATLIHNSATKRSFFNESAFRKILLEFICQKHSDGFVI